MRNAKQTSELFVQIRLQELFERESAAELQAALSARVDGRARSIRHTLL